MESEHAPVGGDGDAVAGDDGHVDVLDVVSHHWAQESQCPALPKIPIAFDLENGIRIHSNLKEISKHF